MCDYSDAFVVNKFNQKANTLTSAQGTSAASSHPHHEPVLMRKASLNVIVPLSKSLRSRVYSLGPYSEDGEEENNSLYREGAYLILGAMLPTLPNVFFLGGGLKITLSSSQQSRNNQFSPAV